MAEVLVESVKENVEVALQAVDELLVVKEILKVEIASVLAESLKENIAVVLHGVDDLRVEKRPLENTQVGDNEVLINIKSVGICASDVHYWKKGNCGKFILEAPMVIGHESAGRIIKVGKNVNNVTEGDLVAIEPGVPCRGCFQCKGGTYNLCPEMKFFATPPVNGSLSNYIVHPADLCFRIPENLTTEHGALCEPLSVGIHACNRAEVGGKNVNVAILGAGPIGLVTLAVAAAYGAKKIIITDITQVRIDVAKKICNHVIGMNVSNMTAEEAALKITEEFGGDGPDVVLDCCGFENSMKTAINAVRSGGKVLLIGCGQNEMKLPLTASSQREVDILGLFRYRNTYPTALQLMSSGKVNIDTLITHRFGLSQEEVIEAFETARTGRGDAIKVMFAL